MVFAYVFVQGWTIDPYVYSFLYQPHEVLIPPPNYTKVVKCSIMTCDVTVVIDREGALEMFFKTSLQMSWLTLLYTYHHIPPCHTYTYI